MSGSVKKFDPKSIAEQNYARFGHPQEPGAHSYSSADQHTFHQPYHESHTLRTAWAPRITRKRLLILGCVLSLSLMVYALVVKTRTFEPNAWLDQHADQAIALMINAPFGSATFLEEQKELGLEDINVFKEGRGAWFFNMNPYSGGYGVCYNPYQEELSWVGGERVDVLKHVRGNWFYFESHALTPGPGGQVSR